MQRLEEEILEKIIQKAKTVEVEKELIQPSKKARMLAIELRKLLDEAASKKDPLILDRWGKILPKKVR